MKELMAEALREFGARVVDQHVGPRASDGRFTEVCLYTARGGRMFITHAMYKKAWVLDWWDVYIPADSAGQNDPTETRQRLIDYLGSN